ncbi:MAG: hypothetical protein D6B28_02760 [Gammaproteobacteria bacterium]|nr:MAG: hypothetical protein D6B28_02760 [Gammaproteobacteria bacterium]
MKKISILVGGILVFICAVVIANEPPKISYTPLPTADKVVVQKAKRMLTLYANDQKIKSYHVHLGANPLGHKQKEGDSRTPEGNYILDWRNPSSSYFLSLHISYPNKDDLENARKKGVSAGGNIMIHGQPNWLSWQQYIKLQNDWTDGCIAVLNHEMYEIWEAVPDGTPITILP